MTVPICLAKHIVETKAGHFENFQLEDHNEAAVLGIVGYETKDQPIAAAT